MRKQVNRRAFVNKGAGYKFMQVLGVPTWNELTRIAKSRDITVQELLRAVILPDWLARNRPPVATAPKKRSHK